MKDYGAARSATAIPEVRRIVLNFEPWSFCGWSAAFAPSSVRRPQLGAWVEPPFPLNTHDRIRALTLRPTCRGPLEAWIDRASRERELRSSYRPSRAQRRPHVKHRAMPWARRLARSSFSVTRLRRKPLRASGCYTSRSSCAASRSDRCWGRLPVTSQNLTAEIKRACPRRGSGVACEE